MMKGILLAGGTGTRLHPLTIATSKQLLPVYDKPMVYYPLSVLMLAGIQDVLVITTKEHGPSFMRLLGSGEQWGMRLSYCVQKEPKGIAQAYLLGEDFIAGDRSALILGDNLFFGHGLTDSLKRATDQLGGATIFGYRVSDPQRYGVVEFGPDKKVISIEEKPPHPKSNFAVTGLYFYDGRASAFARQLKPSGRGELEITDLNRRYLDEHELTVEILGRGFAWLDTGTHETLMQAGEFVRTVEERQGQKIGCPEEVALRMGYIDANRLIELAREMGNTAYGKYLQSIATQEG